MAETFKWPVERTSIGSKNNYRTLNIQFGDGYEQISSDGINNKEVEYTIQVHAYNRAILEIVDFFDRHSGRKSFFWTPPMGNLSLWTCADASPPQPKGGGLYTITGTFRKAYQAT